MATSSFSQNTYPKTIVLSRDTLIAVTKVQFKHTVLLFVDRDRLAVTVDSLNSDIDDWRDLSDAQTKQDSLCKGEIKVLSSLNDDYVKVIKDDEKQLKRQKLYKYIAYGVGIVLTTLLVLK